MAILKPLQLSALSVEQKIGQMLFARRPIDSDDKRFILQMLRDKSLGGIHIIFDMKDDIPEYIEAAGYPVLIGEDMEYGLGQGLGGASFNWGLKKAGETEIRLPSPMAVSATGREEAAYDFGRITAIEAKALGYNCVFGPILDIAMNPLSSSVGARAFGADKETVAKMGCAMIRGYQENGMVVTAKHYPGFGESRVDSHIGMVCLSGDEQSLIERDIYPYLEAARKADLSGVMVGHIMVPRVDDKYPASLSPKLVGLLRKCGYEGLIITDSLAMVGLTNLFDIEQCHRLAMAAGNDMVMTSYRIGTRAAYEYMLGAYRDGAVTEAQIDAAVARVIAAQNRTLKRASQESVRERDRQIAHRISDEAICETGDRAPLDPAQRHLFIVQRGNAFTHPETGVSFREDSGLDDVEGAIRERFANSDIAYMDYFPSRPEIEYMLKTSMDYSSIVFVAYNKCTSYMGSSDFSRRALSFIEGISHKISALILFGNPYAARELTALKRIIYGFEHGYCQSAAIRVLAGELTPTGKLPVQI